MSVRDGPEDKWSCWGSSLEHHLQRVDIMIQLWMGVSQEMTHPGFHLWSWVHLSGSSWPWWHRDSWQGSGGSCHPGDGGGCMHRRIDDSGGGRRGGGGGGRQEGREGWPHTHTLHIQTTLQKGNGCWIWGEGEDGEGGKVLAENKWRPTLPPPNMHTNTHTDTTTQAYTCK